MTDPRCLDRGPRGAICGRLRNHPGSHRGYTFDGRFLMAWRTGDAGGWIEGAGQEADK